MEQITDSFHRAVQLLQVGRFLEAEELGKKIVAAAPGFGDVWHLLGVIALQSGRNEVAADCLRRAVVANPVDAEASNNLGVALKNQNLWDEAIQRFWQAVKLQPTFAEASYNLGHALQERGRTEEAIACYLHAIKQRPKAPQLHQALGRAYQSRGHCQEATTCFRRSVELDPTDYVGRFLLATSLESEGIADEAIREYRRVLEINPAFAEAHSRLGSTLYSQWQLGEAIASYRQAAALLPDSAEIFNCLGAAYKDHGLLDEAVAAYGRALELDSRHVAAWHNLGIVLKETGQLDEAIASLRQALAIDPANARVHSSLLFTLLYHRESTSVDLDEEHRRWSRQHAEPLQKLIRPHSNDATPGRRLRVGYVSPDFRNHVHAHYLVPLFVSHNHTNFEYFCYSSVAWPDRVTEQLRAGTDVWRDVGRLSNEQVAEMIREDRIDILVDMTMHAAGSRLLLFAMKPAPVQVCWMAYPGTTGLATMEYRLTDPYLDPPGMNDRFYSEKSIRLPETFWCYDPLTSEPAVNHSPAVQNGFVTFGSLSNLCKVNDSVIKLWARVLQSVEGSRLIVLAPVGAHRQGILDLLEKDGISAMRIEFVSPCPRAQYLELYHKIDIVLDTWPYNGHTTSLDSLWMGVPVVTQVGQTVVGRAGLSQLMNLGAPELIAKTPDEFVRVARELAGDLARLGELRRTLRDRMRASPLMDGSRFARNIQSVYRQLWQAWCAKQG